MKLFKAIIILTALILLVCNVYAQKDTTNTEFYFNDSKVATAKNNVKVNLFTPFSGDILIGYERALNDFLSVEVRLGRLFGFGHPSVLSYLEEESVMDNITGGFSIHAEGKVFLLMNACEGYYFYTAYRRRNYKSTKENMLFNDFLGGYGYQAVLSNRVLVGFTMGIGLRLKSGSYYDNQTYYSAFEDIGLAMDVGLNIGYVF